ncbi:hypothetical protein BDU57DRAFT_530821 [Ampelomyces quisqualis]|uniref:Uncharacterized protein n=1 Tax=Ampelomyces quisqualis TaxID=50730 RepID=A0A6A5QHY6_AMPQU|nr:hypothetical protein BDU57DRAFT_530821 [Ampelomyces quisqualis]
MERWATMNATCRSWLENWQSIFVPPQRTRLKPFRRSVCPSLWWDGSITRWKRKDEVTRRLRAIVIGWLSSAATSPQLHLGQRLESLITPNRPVPVLVGDLQLPGSSIGGRRNIALDWILDPLVGPLVEPARQSALLCELRTDLNKTGNWSLRFSLLEADDPPNPVKPRCPEKRPGSTAALQPAQKAGILRSRRQSAGFSRRAHGRWRAAISSASVHLHCCSSPTRGAVRGAPTRMRRKHRACLLERGPSACVSGSANRRKKVSKPKRDSRA